MILAFAILPLAAQDRFHIGVELAYQGSESQSEDFITVSADPRIQSGLEVGWRPLSLGPVDIRLVAAMRAKATSDVTVGAGLGSAGFSLGIGPGTKSLLFRAG